MRKYIKLLYVVLVVSFVFCGCSNIGNSNEKIIGYWVTAKKIDKTEFDTTITNYVTTSDLNNTLVERVVMPVISMTKSLKLSSANTWYDTGIDTTSGLESGTYLMQVYINNGSNTGQYNEYFSGIISWHSGTTNSSNSDIIYLSKAGHARNNSVILCY